MADEKVVFAQTFEGLFVRGLGDRITPEVKNELRGLGLDLDKRLLPGYPREVWRKATAVCANRLFAGKAPAEAHFEMGELFIEGFFETLLGKAMLGVLRLTGPARSLERLRKSFRQGNNFSETRLAKLGENHYEVWVNDCFCEQPTFCAAILQAGTAALGPKDCRCTVKEWDGTSATYVIRWS